MGGCEGFHEVRRRPPLRSRLRGPRSGGCFWGVGSRKSRRGDPSSSELTLGSSSVGSFGNGQSPRDCFGGDSPKTPVKPVVLESERDVATHTSEGGCGNTWVVDLGSSVVLRISRWSESTKTLRKKMKAGEEARTPDIQLGKLTLYQLSYTRGVGLPWPVTRLGGA